MQKAVVEALQKLADDVVKVEPTTNVVQLEKDLGDSLFHFEFVLSIEQQLGIKLAHEEWHAFYRSPLGKIPTNPIQTWSEWEREVLPTLTVARLADFVRERYVPVSFEPVSVLGSPPCPAAGYFVGMSELVQQVRPDAKRFGPSTPITQTLPSHSLRLFWRRLSRAAGRSLPELSFWLNHLANALLVASAACLAFGVLVNWAFFAAVWLLCLKGILFGWWLHRRANPLPQGIVTFGDLARHLAGQKNISASRTLSRRAGAWAGRTFLRRRSTETPMERAP
ncbi:MAG: acyl carrier protein [Planctomycetota bacterium]